MAESPARLLFLSAIMGGGGAERHLLALIRALGDYPVELRLALGRAGGSFEPDLPEDLEVTYLADRSPRSSLLAAAKWRRALRRVLASYRPDLVFSLLDHTSVLSLLTRESPRTAHVVGIQNALSVKYSRGPLGRRLLGRLVRSTFPRADGLVACSQAAGRDAATFLRLPASRVEAIPNATREDIPSRAQEPLDVERPPGPLIVACGRLVEQKGFSTLIEAIELVRDRVAASLWIVGEGQDRGALEDQIAKAGLQGAVSLLGFRDNPWNAIAAGDVFALSSYWEGYGLVLDEAMRCGTPIVSTDCPHGTSEVLEEGRCGILVRPRDPRQLADGIVRLLEDPTLRSKLVEAGRERSERTSAHEIAGRYHRLFEEQIRKRAS